MCMLFMPDSVSIVANNCLRNVGFELWVSKSLCIGGLTEGGELIFLKAGV